MDIKVVTVAKVYLKDKQFWKSGFHTAYCTNRTNAISPGEDPPLLKLEFFKGIAYGVPQSIYDAFAAAGIATTDRPRLRGEDD